MWKSFSVYKGKPFLSEPHNIGLLLTVQLDLNLSKNRVWCCTHTQYVQFQSRLALRVHAKLLTRISLAGTSRVSTRLPDVSSRACIIIIIIIIIIKFSQRQGGYKRGNPIGVPPI